MAKKKTKVRLPPSDAQLVWVHSGTQTEVLARLLTALADNLHGADTSSPAPTSTADPSGVPGELRLVGAYLYYRAESGWYRLAGSIF